MEFLEYIGAFCAIAGSIWLAKKWPGYEFGWALFFVASIALATFFLYQEHYAAFAMETVFVLTNLEGLRNWTWPKVKSLMIGGQLNG